MQQIAYVAIGMFLVAVSAAIFLGPLPVPLPQPPQPAPTRPDPATVSAIDATWAAVCLVESGGDPLAINHLEGAAGIAQIRLICLDDCNRIVRLAGGPAGYWTWNDRFDPAKSREMFATYVTHFAQCDQRPEVWARIWNGGPEGFEKSSTLNYWRRVSAAMKR